MYFVPCGVTTLFLRLLSNGWSCVETSIRFLTGVWTGQVLIPLTPCATAQLLYLVFFMPAVLWMCGVSCTLLVDLCRGSGQTDLFLPVSTWWASHCLGSLWCHHAISFRLFSDHCGVILSTDVPGVIVHGLAL